MFINPLKAIEEGWITHPECSTTDDWIERKFVSPNAIDFTLDALFIINKQNPFRISEQGKTMRGTTEYPPLNNHHSNTPFWKLDGDSVYDGMSDMYVKIPSGVACELIIRSTYSRNGIFITSGIYDSSFCGHIGFAIHNRLGEAYIGKGTRIGQIKFIQSENYGKYAGSYNHDQGTHWDTTNAE